MLIDTHAHLNDERLLPEAESIVSDMEKDNLSAIINVGYDLPSSRKSLELSKKYDRIFGTAGLHPHDASKACSEAYDFFAAASKDAKIVAVGEIGLDFYYDLSPRDVQERVFLEQLELAYSLKMPSVIHLRDAYGLMLKLLKENSRLLYYGAVLHCYSGSAEMLAEFAKLGLYFSFGGAVTFKNAVDKPAVLAACPLDALMLETDCPYMTPAPYRGQVNYPKYISLVARKVAELTNKETGELEKVTSGNALRLFEKLRLAACMAEDK